jgi:hypothetical protein
LIIFYVSYYLLGTEDRLMKNKYCLLHCKKRLSIFPSPAGMSPTELSLARTANLFYSVGQCGKILGGSLPEEKRETGEYFVDLPRGDRQQKVPDHTCN